jgi:predicted ATPase/class 3 adenylate cyclase
VKNLIPSFIYNQSKKGSTHGRMEAFTMFIDLSGFTSLTQTLMKRGNEGAEQLSIILNDIFAPMVELVYCNGGIIPYFAGDAFTGVFPLHESNINERSFLYTAQQIRDLFDRDKASKNHFGDFSIGIKIGLSFGEVEWGIIGEQYKQFYFRGEAIDDCAACEHHAFDRDIILNDKIRNAFAKRDELQLEVVEDGFYKLQEDVVWKGGIIRHAAFPVIELSALRSFLPESVIDYNQAGEFRNVVTVFISFMGVDNHTLLNEFATIVLNQINSFSGYFKEIDFGDKGGVLVGFFGAPVSYENNVERALEFLLSVQDSVKGLMVKGLAIRAGVTSGIAFTGIVGGGERSQYAVVGNEVNLAARLMIGARWGEILVDEDIQKSHSYQFAHLRNARYKGFEKEIPTYQFLGRKADEQLVYTGDMVGRAVELNKLSDFVNTLLEKGSSGIAYLYGEAGIGKTRLSFELKKKLKTSDTLHWFTCPADQILGKPFNPFIAQLKNFFEQHSNNSPEKNLMGFEENFNRLLEALEKKDKPEAEQIQKELRRTKSILAAQLGIFSPGSLWGNLDAQGRYQNILTAFHNYITAVACIGPLVLEIEDGHWYDSDSIRLLNELIVRLKQYPVVVLVTSRYNDDGTKPMLFDSRIIEREGLPICQIELNTLSENALKIFAEDKLGAPIDSALHKLLVKSANGNPFYLEQILAYLQESNILTKQEGQWHIEDATIKLPSSMNAVLTARIDRLSTLVKETVKAAAVIGREFELPVLKEVMIHNEAFIEKNGNAGLVLKEQVRTAEDGQIWSALSELRYIFTHSLLRETVYDMQMHTRLRKLHLLIGKAIEKLYAPNLESKYVDLAFHYGQAEVEGKKIEYLEKAADFFRSNFQNQQAISYYEKLENVLQAKKETEHLVRILLKKGPVMELIGQWDDSEKTYRQAMELLPSLTDRLLKASVSNSLGRILLLKGRYEKAKSHFEVADTIFTECNDAIGKFNVLGDLGTFYFRQGKYEEAKNCFNASIQKSHSIPHNTAFAKIVSSLGLTHMNLGNFREGINCQLDALKICEYQQDKQGMATLHTNLGIVYYEKGDLDDALMHYMEGLSISKELGNKQLTAIATGCIGTVYQQQGKFGLALKNYEEDLQLCEELGDKQGTAIAYGLLGELRSVEGAFDIAISYLEQQLALSKKLGYQKGAAKALNSLGDVYFLQNEFQQSVHYYQEAIELARSIDNVPVLGMSLVEQGFVFATINDQPQAAGRLHEVKEILTTLDNPDLRFKCIILEAKVLALQDQTEAAIQLLTKQLDENLSIEEQAKVHYVLFQLKPDGNIHRNKAFVLYQTLHEQMPKIIFKNRIDKLKPSE